MFLQKIKSLLSCLVLVGICLCGCSRADSVLSYIEAGNAEMAAREYSQSIGSDYKKESEFIDSLNRYLLNTFKQLNNGEMTRSRADKILDAVDALPVSVHYDCQNVIDAVETLIASKQSYEDAVQASAQGDYASACALFAEVNPSDTNYDSAREKCVEAYTSAIAAVHDSVTQMIASGNDADASQTLNIAMDVWGEDNTLSELLSQVTAQWEAETLAQAEAAFGTGKDYEAAIRVLQTSGLTSESVNAAIARYQEYVPVSLTDMEPTKHSKVSVGSYKATITEDVNGHSYAANTVIYLSGDYRDEGGYIIYYLGANYSKLSGVIYRPYCSLEFDDSDWKNGTTEKIYGDGVLLYTGPVVTQQAYEEYPFDIDVTGVRELKITLSGVGIRRDGSGWGLPYPMVCMADLKLSR